MSAARWNLKAKAQPLCACSNPGVYRHGNSWVCARCHELESQRHRADKPKPKPMQRVTVQRKVHRTRLEAAWLELRATFVIPERGEYLTPAERAEAL